MVSETRWAVEAGAYFALQGLAIVCGGWVSARIGGYFAAPEKAFQGVTGAFFSSWRRAYYYLLLLPQAIAIAVVAAMFLTLEQCSYKILCVDRIQFFVTVLVFHYVMSIVGAKPVIDDFAKFIADRGHTEQAVKNWKQCRKSA